MLQDAATMVVQEVKEEKVATNIDAAEPAIPAKRHRLARWDTQSKQASSPDFD